MGRTNVCGWSSIRRAGVSVWLSVAVLQASAAAAQIKAALPGNITPPWDQGIQPISSASYWNAVECGKQGGANPACVFYDTGLCKNEDFDLALYTPYKMVAYEVWRVVRQRQPAPTPSYQEAQRTRVTIGVKPVKGSKNQITAVTITRGGKKIPALSRSLDAGEGRFTFDYAPFAATDDITLELVGKTATRSCLVEKAVLTLFR